MAENVIQGAFKNRLLEYRILIKHTFLNPFPINIIIKQLIPDQNHIIHRLSQRPTPVVDDNSRPREWFQHGLELVRCLITCLVYVTI